jgi:hypothetical protein
MKLTPIWKTKLKKLLWFKNKENCLNNGLIVDCGYEQIFILSRLILIYMGKLYVIIFKLIVIVNI